MHISLILAGLLAGCVTGLFGAGGGLVLVPLLRKSPLEKEALFSCSVAIILPVCLTVLSRSFRMESLWDAAPYLPGSALGGILGAKYGKRIPVKWLHRLLGIFILWGGIRYLCL